MLQSPPHVQGSSDFSYVVAVAKTVEEITTDWTWLCDILVPTLGTYIVAIHRICVFHLHSTDKFLHLL